MKMLNIYSTILLLVAVCVPLDVHAQDSTAKEEAISVESLLREMIDRESVARFPASNFRLKQVSSYNRESKTPEPPRMEPKGWYANKDYRKGSIRVEEKEGRKEWVLMDDQGPGTLVRSWMPWKSGEENGKGSTIRIYLDGAAKPVIEGDEFELFQGKGLIPFPLAHESLRSAVSFFPIPYAKSCKITVSEKPFFFQFTYRKYDPETKVKTFTMEDFKASSGLIEEVCTTLLDPTTPKASASSKTPATQDFVGPLGPGEERTLELPFGIHGPQAIRRLSLKLGSYDDPSVTRSVVLKMKFDGKETVWCPVGDFFGTGIGLHPFQGWYRTVGEDGMMSSRWVMPYQKSGEISVVNLSDQVVFLELFGVSVRDWQWDKNSMYFHAQWRGQYPVKTRPFSDWNYITTKGRGVYVGDTLTIMNPVEKWWGEGDEKIFVDGEKFPSIFGTGTEDYYAYSWGGKSTDFYEHPFHNQPRSNVYNKLNRKTEKDERNTQGYSTEGRTRALDTMPFGKSLQLDMEVWSGSDCDMGYGVGVFWYGDAQTSSNRKPDPEGVLLVPPLPSAMLEK